MAGTSTALQKKQQRFAWALCVTCGAIALIKNFVPASVSQTRTDALIALRRLEASLRFQLRNLHVS